MHDNCRKSRPRDGSWSAADVVHAEHLLEMNFIAWKGARLKQPRSGVDRAAAHQWHTARCYSTDLSGFSKMKADRGFVAFRRAHGVPRGCAAPSCGFWDESEWASPG